MNTAFGLMARFDSPTVHLKDICKEFFGITPHTAEVQAKAGKLPIPVFKLRQSEKSPTMVHVDELGNWIDSQRAKARENWDKIHN